MEHRITESTYQNMQSSKLFQNFLEKITYRNQALKLYIDIKV